MKYLLILITTVSAYAHYPPEKYHPALHTGLSAGITAGAYYFLPEEVDKGDKLLYSMVMGTAVGLIKELGDQQKNDRFNTRDMMWNSLGVGIGMGFLIKVNF